MAAERRNEDFLSDTELFRSQSTHDADDASDIAPCGKLKKIAPKKSRKQKHQWNDTEILNLIFLVEQHSALWDYGSEEYKMSRKDSWSDVVDALGIADVDAEEAKLKWGNLKLTFNSNMVKYRKTKSGQGADETGKVIWRFFKPMFFLEANNFKKSTQSTSSLILENGTSDESILDDAAAMMSVPQPTVTPTAVGKRQKRCLDTPTPSISPAPSTSSLVKFREKATEALNTALSPLTDRRPADAYSSFAQMALFKMHELPKEEADDLLWTLNECLTNFCRAKQRRQATSQSSPVSFSDQHGRDISDESISLSGTGLIRPTLIERTPHTISDAQTIEAEQAVTEEDVIVIKLEEH